jgi:hypothetical protein
MTHLPNHVPTGRIKKGNHVLEDTTDHTPVACLPDSGHRTQ